ENVLAIELTPGQWLSRGYPWWEVVFITGSINALRFILEIAVYWSGISITKLLFSGVSRVLQIVGLRERLKQAWLQLRERFISVRRGNEEVDVTLSFWPSFEFKVIRHIKRRMQINGALARRAIIRKVGAGGYVALFLAGIVPYVAALGALVVSLRINSHNLRERPWLLVNSYLCLVAGSIVRMLILVVMAVL
ncbi:MAG: hypothetical protein HY974_00025, partial [Candidatus Kerfeldbacteria bacterium]|nr:hypothetical protein [Candidatus Kerfeldbacteria bacterium]